MRSIEAFKMVALLMVLCTIRIRRTSDNERHV